jgi:hypothetical protein
MRLYELKESQYTRDELLELDWDELCELAYGVKTGDIIQLDPRKIKIKYTDMENPQDLFNKYGMAWVRTVKFDEPVQVSLGFDGNHTKEDWYLEDGHHRVFAARKLKMPTITAEVERINLKAVEKLLGFPNAKKRRIKEDEDYRGEHTAPYNNGYDRPLHDLTGIYPDDIYTGNAARLYSSGESYDNASISIMQGARGRPNQAIKIYRAVPHELTNDELVKKYEKEKALMLKTGRLPTGITGYTKSQYYEFVSNELDRLANAPATAATKIGINPGDWVSISKQYAIDHGRANLGNKFKVITKTVKAKDLYTDGNSIHEWGYSPM